MKQGLGSSIGYVYKAYQSRSVVQHTRLCSQRLFEQQAHKDCTEHPRQATACVGLAECAGAELHAALLRLLNAMQPQKAAAMSTLFVPLQPMVSWQSHGTKVHLQADTKAELRRYITFDVSRYSSDTVSDTSDP